MTLRAERADLPQPVQEFELVHRENPLGTAVMLAMFAINILGFLALAAVLIDIAEGVSRGQQAALAVLAQLSVLTGIVTVWAGLAVVCGAVRYFNRRTFIRVPGKE